eukprot:TRINITY_DN16175_c0_g1_i1.p1 TRINITY_DN16175_c0_g1~~TRINITY_DN16175_c0_g1_i1.p1  ORF type:complete len:100 (+),score=16.62 TRINITY_DN16175_c0_g1_i1:138-437(+)
MCIRDRNCPVGSNLSLVGDAHCSNLARTHIEWLESDEKVIGISIYRLKNLWSDPLKDVCLNPAGSGLGLVDRCTSTGKLAMPETLSMYQHLTGNRSRTN